MENHVAYLEKIEASIQRARASFHSQDGEGRDNLEGISEERTEDFTHSDDCHSVSEADEVGLDKEQQEDLSNLFAKTRNLIKTGKVFRLFSYLYSERKMIVAFALHFVLTMVIWGHFAVTKFRTQEGNVPEIATNYYWKIYAPTLEFGAMHAILFQLSLLPLTMSRLSISKLSSSVVEKIIPFNRMVQFHIHLGYTMVLIVILATVFFFIFFGVLCADGEEEFCSKFSSQIMITGYLIVGLLIMVALTSYFRERIPYEVFYVVHHLVFSMFLITIAHTMDDEQRAGKERSQTFRWFSASLLYYICDRSSMYINHRYSTSIISSSAVVSGSSSRMAIIKLKKPVRFQFSPGQYAYLKFPSVDGFNWHPFSIASAPGADVLEFCIEVCDEGSWTAKLWNCIDKYDGYVVGRSKLSLLQRSGIPVEIMGPYGSCLGNVGHYSHAIAIGTGTGIVPMLSLFKQHVRDLLKLDPKNFFDEEERRNMIINEAYREKRMREGSIFNLIRAPCRRSDEETSYLTDAPVSAIKRKRLSSALLSIDDSKVGTTDFHESQKFRYKEVKGAARRATVPIYGNVARTLIPILGITMIGVTLSWNMLAEQLVLIKKEKVHVDQLFFMEDTLKVGTIIFQVIFFLETIFVHNRAQFLTYIDVVFSLISFAVDWYWFENDLWASFDTSQLFYYSLLMGYMALRAWTMAVDNSSDFFAAVSKHERSPVLSKLHLIWVTRSASLASEILPDISNILEHLCQEWGEKAAKRVLQITVHVTDPNIAHRRLLEHDLRDTSLLKNGIIKFGRPIFQDIIDHNITDRIIEANSFTGKYCSNTLLAFCGSPSLANEVHRAKILTDMTTVISGNNYHCIDFVSESYGVRKETVLGEGNGGVEDTNLSSNPAPSCDENTDDFGSVENDSFCGIDQNNTRRHDAFFSYGSSSNVEHALGGRVSLVRTLSTNSSMQSVLGTKAMHRA
mmetsp:Transcript_9287/g.13747  ORF Transcript_9287/g.13747 Transcript_9287/m.13747 type:complete len:959 (+) Transcript_9287:157-3033(+)|eukprot:CAMPEP_0196808302 /NCGR_PEP_ID=MMETSP1362-20130617/8297_1 /TAXON_ID=163516 /ORGANISM="Leptocylindrus danicus, Strain CCMP1856" /LENGTH=958 /DNA_ID=CAMNT_0042182593 /DNA_START=83 /DNA_END=2959 /DNA_ORIENTATION=-